MFCPRADDAYLCVHNMLAGVACGFTMISPPFGPIYRGAQAFDAMKQKKNNPKPYESLMEERAPERLAICDKDQRSNYYSMATNERAD